MRRLLERNEICSSGGRVAFGMHFCKEDRRSCEFRKTETRPVILSSSWPQKTSTFLESQVEMGKMGLSLDEVSATKTVNEELEKLRAENERARQQQENFLRMQR
jgi:hypothetical protein